MKRRGNYKFLDKYSWYIPGVGGMFALLAWLLLGAALGAIVTAVILLATGQMDTFSSYSTVISYPLMFIPPMIWASVKSANASMNNDGLKLDNNHFSPLGGAVCALIAAAGTLAVGFWAEAVGTLLPPMPPVLAEAMQSMTNGNIWINLLCVSIMAPLFEEWLCRGMVLRGLLGNKMKPAMAIVLSAFFFAFIHLNPWQAVPAFLLGCLFGYVYYKTGSLKLTMLMHCVNNTFAVAVSRVDGWEDIESWAEVLPQTSYHILLAASVLLTALVVLAFRKVQMHKAEGNMDAVPSLFSSDEI